jgi:HPt (histidine-containing phosphotransfer) domain-containing protein
VADEAVDGATLAELFESIGGDREFLDEFIETYIGDYPSLLAALREGLASDDAAAVRRAAHTLKSTSLSVGALRLATMAREIEATAEAASLVGAAPLVEATTAEFAAVAVALRAVAGAGEPGEGSD